MKTVSPFRYVLSDVHSLNDFMEGKTVSFEDVKRRISSFQQTVDSGVPDRFYTLSANSYFKDISTVGDIFCKGFSSLADDFLEFENDRLYVKEDKFIEWQQLVSEIPPLLLISAFLYKNKPLSLCDNKFEYINTYIIPNVRYTALLSPNIKSFKEFFKANKGFHDLHMHLNGSTEVDIIWQSLLRFPRENMSEISATWDKSFVLSQFEHIGFLHSPKEFSILLKKARCIRFKLFDIVMGSKKENSKDDPFICEFEKLHPFATCFCSDAVSEMPLYMLLRFEVFMYISVFFEMENNEACALLFYKYVLILGLVNRFLVQRVEENGFDKFQQITMNGFREESEKEYYSRFLQLAGNKLEYISFLEGRFSPKDCPGKNYKELKKIDLGWNSFIKEFHRTEYEDSKKEEPQLKLIAHFIKKRDEHPDSYIRFKSLRDDLDHRGNVLWYMKKNESAYIKNLVGIDAASSEFDAPPEVFAPLYKKLRNVGFKHFTFHAGEDFYHILSGLRAIYEAVTFCDLKKGDRIGHATATGVDASFWSIVLGKNICIPQGEYLDNLVFAHAFIIEKDIKDLQEKLPFLRKKISEYSYNVYKSSFTPELLEKAWHQRKFDPKDFINKKFPSEVEEIACKYNSNVFKKNYDKTICINYLDDFTVDEITLLQQKVLEFLHKSEIVIETLPTSNVRIGCHKNFDTYQLWNWIKWKKEGHAIPPIVLGTDDAGIFATNIYNEMATVFCYLVYEKKLSRLEALEIIERIDKNSKLYRFE